MKKISDFLIALIVVGCFMFMAISSEDEPADSSAEPERKTLVLENLKEIDDVLVKKWIFKDINDFVKEYGEATSAYDSGYEKNYIWEDLVEIKEPAGTFTYDIWVGYYEHNQEFIIQEFKIGNKSKK